MQDDTKVEVTAEVREAVLSTIQHEDYRTLATLIMDVLTLEQIQAKVDFDELQYKSMVDHIAKISAETVVAEPTPKDAPTTVTPAVTSETPNATNVPVNVADIKEAVASIGGEVVSENTTATEMQVQANMSQPNIVASDAPAPEASQPANDANTAKTEELTA